MKSIKEKQILVKWAKAMNEPIDPALVEEVERYTALQESVAASVKTNIFSDLADAAKNEPPKVQAQIIAFPVPPSLDELEQLLKETTDELVQTQAPQEPTLTEEAPPPRTPVTESLIDRAVTHIAKEVKSEETSYQQPDADLTGRSVNDIRKKLKFLEDWISKISLTGPGGGAGDVINLDHPVKVVGSDYTFTRRDYYVGVNATSSVTLTLPDAIGYPGRVIVVKDESGNCSNNPIVVTGTVDNDPGGFILQMDNGGVQMIYREGWRII
jgi:hypothetical protein